MTVIHGIVVDCHDPRSLAAFWGEALGYESRMDEPEWVSLRKPGGGAPFLSFQLVPEGKVVKNRLHIDIRPDGRGFEEERARLEALGARTLQFFDKGEWSHYIMADPEDNEFCLLTPEHAAAL
jgi:hypothetical protein